MDLSKLLSPRSIAVIGASQSPTKIGSTVVTNLQRAGFRGAIYPINPKSATIHGLPAFGRIGDVPAVPDLAVICTPAASVPGLVHECGQMGVRALIILTAGFRELGPSGLELEEQIRQAQTCYPGLRINGPNCLGIISPWCQMSASFAVGMPKPGSVAFLSQSGALCTAILDWALSEDIGFSHFVSLGNQLDIGFADLLDHLADDAHTTAAILYVESIPQAGYFLEAASRFASLKPLIAYKAGRFAESAQAATSHTGAMAGVDAVYEAAFQRVGIVRVFDLESMFECAELLARHPQPVGRRLAIVTNAGGPGVMATDALLAGHGQLASLGEATVQRLNEFLPASWSHHNPVDVLGDSDPERFAQAVRIVSEDPNVDTLLALLTPQSMTQPELTARLVAQVAMPEGKTLLASWMGGQQMASGIALLQAAQIPTFSTPEQAIGGFNHLTAYARAREANLEFRRQDNAELEVDFARSIDVPLSTRAPGRTVVTELLSSTAAKELLERYGIPVATAQAAHTEAEAVALAAQIGYPVVLKILSPQITHKTEVHGVALNIRSDDEVRQQYAAIVASAKTLRPDAVIAGVTIEPMIALADSVELIVGMKRDVVFGPVIMVGYGGIAAEVFQDRALDLPPVCSARALRMLKSLRCWPLLAGYRNRPPVDLARLTQAIAAFANLVRCEPSLTEADINPLMAGPDRVVALDARFVRINTQGGEAK